MKSKSGGNNSQSNRELNSLWITLPHAGWPHATQTSGSEQSICRTKYTPSRYAFRTSADFTVYGISAIDQT